MNNARGLGTLCRTGDGTLSTEIRDVNGSPSLLPERDFVTLINLLKTPLSADGSLARVTTVPFHSPSMRTVLGERLKTNYYFLRNE